MPHGKLTVIVDGATNIKTPGVYGNGGSYCTLSCGSQVFNSPTIEGGGSHPHFNTAFEFEIDRTTNHLDVCVYSKSSSRGEDLVGYCKLDFKTVFFKGHEVPLTAFPLQQPAGNSGGQINLILKFKMRPSPNRHNTHVPVRCSSETSRVVHVAHQSLPVDWGYDEKDYRRTQPDQPRHREAYLNMPGTEPTYHNPPEPAPEPAQPSFVRLNSPKLRKPSPRPNQPIPGKPHYNQPVPSKPRPHVFVQAPMPPPQPPQPNVVYQVVREGMEAVGESVGQQVAEHVMAEAGNQAMFEMGNQAMFGMGNQAMFEMGNQAMFGMGNQAMFEMGNQAMFGMGNQAMFEMGNQAMFEMGNQAMAQGGSQFFAGLLGLGLS